MNKSIHQYIILRYWIIFHIEKMKLINNLRLPRHLGSNTRHIPMRHGEYINTAGLSTQSKAVWVCVFVESLLIKARLEHRDDRLK